MARVKTPSYIMEPGGRMGDLVFYSCRGKVYTRMYTKPANPNTDKQKAVRKTFGDAVRSWQSLPADIQAKYNKKARRINLSGYNMYISQYMKGNLLSGDPGSRSFTASCNYMDSIRMACPSVTAPLSLQYGPFSPYLTEFPVLSAA